MAQTAQVYVVHGAKTTPMNRVHCKDEDRELQALLYHNPNLLPGDQIRPEDPRRWLVVKREMAVQNPGTGGDRWSIDFLFADQNAMPTFIECKRFLDTRSRREVIGQMLEYAANGQHYWNKSLLRVLAEQTAKERGADLETTFRQLDSEIEDVDRFFDAMERNLREGQIRLVFFLEEAPAELKSIVEFLNKQMERSEVLIVEAKQYELDGVRGVAPALFGYTEQARQVKREVMPSTATRQWDEGTFFTELRSNVSEQGAAAITRLYDYCLKRGFAIKWGKGLITGSLNLANPRVMAKSLIQVNTSGELYVNFGWLTGDEAIEAYAARFAAALRDTAGLSVPATLRDKFPRFTASQWTPKGTALEQILDTLDTAHREEPAPTSMHTM
jgi:hypothetical protein